MAFGDPLGPQAEDVAKVVLGRLDGAECRGRHPVACQRGLRCPTLVSRFSSAHRRHLLSNLATRPGYHAATETPGVGPFSQRAHPSAASADSFGA